MLLFPLRKKGLAEIIDAIKKFKETIHFGCLSASLTKRACHLPLAASSYPGLIVQDVQVVR
jgi:hypothetical protein